MLKIRKAKTNKYWKVLNRDEGNLGKANTVSFFGKLIEKSIEVKFINGFAKYLTFHLRLNTDLTKEDNILQKSYIRLVK